MPAYVYWLSFAAALLMSCGAIPLSLWAAQKCGALDIPGERKIHLAPIPRWGGMGIFIAVVASIITSFCFLPPVRELFAFRKKIILSGGVVEVFAPDQIFCGIALGSSVALAAGLFDDKKPLPPLVKFLLQAIAAYTALDYGLRLSGVELGPWGFVRLPLFVGQIVSVVWLAGFMNAVNLADGLDGLAAGICAIAAGTFWAVSLLAEPAQTVIAAKQMQMAALLASAVGGACVGFLWFNFYPAKVFMGDGGAYFLGYLLGAMALLGSLKRAALLSLVLPILVVAFPLLDAFLALLRRLRAGRSIVQADRGHLHHRLLDLGWTQREVVLAIYVATLLLSIVTILSTVVRFKK